MRGHYEELYRRPLSAKTSTELKLLIGAWSPSPRAHEACLVGGAIYGDPVGRVHAPLSGGSRRNRIRAGHLDPAALPTSNRPYISSELDEVLILAEQQRHVELAVNGHLDHVQADPDVDALLLADDGDLRLSHCGGREEITPLGALRRCQRGRMTEAYQTKPARER